MTKRAALMKGVQLTGHGGLDKLELRSDIAVPVPSATDVLIKVSAAGVNNTDLNTRVGWYSKSDDSDDASWSGSAIGFPLIQGADVCGEVFAVGDSVDAEMVGKRVLIEPCLQEAHGKKLEEPWYFGSECNGGFAEYTVVAAQHAHVVNSDMSDVELASFPCSYSTAENLLTRAAVTAKDRLLITGASGGVGSAIVQLAKARGAQVIAVTSLEKAEAIEQLGADETIPRDASLTDILGRNSIDVVIDLVAGKQWSELLEVLKPFGRYAASGAIAGPLVELDVRTLYLKDLTLIGCTVLSKEVFPNLVKLIEQRKVSPLVAKTFSLQTIKDAQQEFQEKQHIGKFVIDVLNS